MALQLRAQDPARPPKPAKPDTLTVKVFRSGPHLINPATIPKDAILQVDTVKGAVRGDGACDFDTVAGTPIRKPGTLRVLTGVGPCSIIYWTVDSAKFVDATKRAKPTKADTVRAPEASRELRGVPIAEMQHSLSNVFLRPGYPWLPSATR